MFSDFIENCSQQPKVVYFVAFVVAVNLFFLVDKASARITDFPWNSIPLTATNLLCTRFGNSVNLIPLVFSSFLVYWHIDATILL